MNGVSECVTAKTTTAPESIDRDFGFDLEHWYCNCNPDIAMCGADLTGDAEAEPIESEDDCVVCLDLRDAICPRCGE